MNRVFMGIGQPRGVDVRKWRSSEVTLGRGSSFGTSDADAESLARFYQAVEAGTATKTDGFRALAVVGREAERVCDEYGQDSVQCSNIRAAGVQLAEIVQTLPSSVPSSYGTGTVVVVGLVAALLGFGAGWMLK